MLSEDGNTFAHDAIGRREDVMGIPRWFEATLIEAQDAKRPVNYGHLGEQCGLRIEEVLPKDALKLFWDTAKGWTSADDATGKAVEALFDEYASDCMSEVPADSRPEFLAGLWRKRG